MITLFCLRDDVAADQLHGRVRVGGLLAEDRAGEHGVVAAVATQLDLNGKLILGIPNSGHLKGRFSPAQTSCH